jgi:exopolysaccharide biosynthesis WecB/TagA/CpsF family protein
MTDIVADPAGDQGATPRSTTVGLAVTPRRVPVLNVYVDDISMDDLLEMREGAMATLHVDMIVKLQHDRDFYDIWDTFDVVTCDSQFLYFALKLLRRGVCMRVSGSDYFPKFYTRYADDPSVTVFLVGAAPGIAEKARADINAKVGREIIVGTNSPAFGFRDGTPENDALIEEINASGATVLLVALAAGRQEKWIASNRHRMPNVKLFLPLGGTIDYEANAVKRPPAFITNIGLEWFWRLAREPKRRWRRYVIEEPKVIPYLVRDAFGKYRNPFST